MAASLLDWPPNLVYQREDLRRIPKRRIVPALASLAAQFDHYMLDLGVFFKRVHRHILADAALLVAAMWHLRDQRQVIIDPDRAEL